MGINIRLQPLKGIMTSFPILDGNKFQRKEEEKEKKEKKSSLYKAKPSAPPYWNKGVLTFNFKI